MVRQLEEEIVERMAILLIYRLFFVNKEIDEKAETIYRKKIAVNISESIEQFDLQEMAKKLVTMMHNVSTSVRRAYFAMPTTVIRRIIE